jgi:hypothetical protein
MSEDEVQTQLPVLEGDQGGIALSMNPENPQRSVFCSPSPPTINPVTVYRSIHKA